MITQTVVTLHIMSVDEKTLLIRLIELYNYEFSAFSNDDINEYGYYGYDHIDDYRKEVDARYFGEFFVMLKYRRMGIGKQVATQLFELHRGPWEVCWWKNNVSAGLF